ncbi:MAG: hypothetical protein E7236_01705 [Lachnospiraceae bacterium]|nr:hypothetical protein [Lachnospiraceae bacterium]
MKAHKNFSIIAAILLVITIFTGFYKPARKLHAVGGMLMVICFIGAMISGKKMITPKKKAEAAENADEMIDKPMAE